MKTLDEMIAVMTAARDGKRIRRFGRLNGGSEVLDPNDFVWDWVMWDYNIAPEPKRVPLGPEDVPPGSVVRANIGDGRGWCAVGTVLQKTATVCTSIGFTTETWEQLMAHWDISRDGGKTWQPCWKEA